jgi:sugar phosphate isomerase/epimerase
MYNTLNTGHLGISGFSLPQQIDLAARTGFRGLSFDLTGAVAIAEEKGVDALKALFDDAGIRPGAWSPPVDWQNDAVREQQLEALRPMAGIAAQIGATTTLTWVLPGNNDRDRDAQYAWYMERLRPFAQVLADAGISLALEFIGPKTLRDQFTHEFVWRMQDMLALARDTGTGNVGLLFDTYHFYTSHAEMDEIDALDPGDVLLVHTNDAPAGLEIEEQLDGVRTLPMETGVIPAPEMLRRLHAIGVECPVETEPFSARVREIAASDPEAAAREAFAAQKALFQAAGLEV